MQTLQEQQRRVRDYRVVRGAVSALGSFVVCESDIFNSDRLRFPSGIISKKVKTERSSHSPNRPEAVSNTPVAPFVQVPNVKNRTTAQDVQDQEQWQSSLWLDAEDQIHLSGSSSGLPLIERLSNLHLGCGTGTHPTERIGRALSTETDALRRSSLPSQPTPDRTPGHDVWDALLAVCPSDLLDRLIRNHLDYTESMWPILHCPTFLNHYMDVKKKAVPCTREFGALLMALCAISSRSIDDDPSVLGDPNDKKTAGVRYFICGNRLLQEKRSDLHCIQALFYLAMYAEGLGQASVHASLVGQAIALAFASGMHQASEHWNFDCVVSECRKRVFWAIYSLDKAVACAIGRPPMLRIADCNVPLRTCITLDSISPQPPEKPNVLQAACNATTQINAVVEHMLLACNTPPQIYPRKDKNTQTDIIYSFRHHYPAFDRIAILSRADSMLDRWHANLPDHLRAPRNLDEALKLKGDARFIQSCRLEIAHNLIRALIARERIALELKDKPLAPPGPLSLSAARAEQSCENIIRLYDLLSVRDLLKSFGMQQIQHLAACGHTFLAMMVIYSNISAVGVRRLQDTIRLLRERSHFPSAMRAIDILSDMASKFDIPLSEEPRNGGKISWLRMLHRRNAQGAAPTRGPSSSRASSREQAFDDRSVTRELEAGEVTLRPRHPSMSKRHSLSQQQQVMPPPQPTTVPMYQTQPIVLAPAPAVPAPQPTQMEIPQAPPTYDAYGSYDSASIDLQAPYLLQPAAAPAYEAPSLESHYGHDVFGGPLNPGEIAHADFYGGARRMGVGPGSEMPQDSFTYLFQHHHQGMQNSMGR
ncbi:hypothetical protein PUNSTDRAFT_135683 [Punctularia strigosozonata HHB-11173 SS5]|uniref:uncharacterized protein n=1 Tax=Punctularia strigosozonata (strain HHB-11173) TaxID=741275 RepID=UPI0004417407|nr:uncharacterized protein PUNSTDRAFT_135683 [Punctularia strigosozonata HHB-11173 SS5]EIN06981.1 hypothetical protein PUNSTDRAFT_135683 [Punctularia strigosozonata HHB-11173 SS5]